jgi:type I restriction enzyme, S subunit
MVQKQEFMETEIGRITGDWKSIVFKDILVGKIKHGIYKSKEFFTYNGVRILKMGIQYSNDKIGYQKMERVAVTEDELRRFKIEKGNLIFSRTSMMTDGAGKCSLVIDHADPIVFDGNLLCSELNPKIANPEFYFYFFNSKTAKDEISRITTGTQSRNISGSNLMKMFVPLPPLQEQRAIACILSLLDDKIALNRQMNSTLEAIGQALFRRWFVDFEFPDEGGKQYRSSGGEMVETELGEVPKGWRVASIGDLDNSIKYGDTQSASSEPIGPKFLRITDIQGGKIEWSNVPYCKISENDIEKYVLLSGDIVIARTGASTGENVYIEECPKAVFASYLVRIRFKNKNLARYVAKFMRSQVYRDYIDGCIGGSAQPNASAKTLAAVNLIIPPDTELIKFGEIVESIELIKSMNNNKSTVLTQIRDALLPKLMSGEIRVRTNSNLNKENK